MVRHGPKPTIGRNRQVILTDRNQPCKEPNEILERIPTDLEEICVYIRECDYRQLDRVWVSLAMEMFADGCSASQMASLLNAVRDCFRDSIDESDINARARERVKKSASNLMRGAKHAGST